MPNLPLRRLAALPVVALLALPLPAEAAPRTLTGTIVRFECGDNCYLTIKPKGGREFTGLCVAPQCRPWNEAVALPRRLLGARVTVSIGVGRQYDGSGNDMGPFPSVTSISGLPR